MDGESNQTLKTKLSLSSESLSTYIGLSFALFVGFLPTSYQSLMASLQLQNRKLSSKLREAEALIEQMKMRRAEDSKANAKVMGIFASQRQAWQQEKNSLVQRLSELKLITEKLQKDVEEREEFIGVVRERSSDLQGLGSRENGRIRLSEGFNGELGFEKGAMSVMQGCNGEIEVDNVEIRVLDGVNGELGLKKGGIEFENRKNMESQAFAGALQGDVGEREEHSGPLTRRPYGSQVSGFREKGRIKVSEGFNEELRFEKGEVSVTEGFPKKFVSGKVGSPLNEELRASESVGDEFEVGKWREGKRFRVCPQRYNNWLMEKNIKTSEGMDEEKVICSLKELSEALYYGDYCYPPSASKLWSERAFNWQDTLPPSHESQYDLKHIVPRRESPWKIDGESMGLSSKLKFLEQDLVNLESGADKGKAACVSEMMRKQAKRYQALVGKVEELCKRMQASDPCEPNLDSGSRKHRQTEYLSEVANIQEWAAETGHRLVAIESVTTPSRLNKGMAELAKPSIRRSLDSTKNNFKEIQRILEIRLARITGDLEGMLAQDGMSHVSDPYFSRYSYNY
ncbi:hypothetical protein AMTRI_Chr03g50970 [Amborella trichopoda]